MPKIGVSSPGYAHHISKQNFSPKAKVAPKTEQLAQDSVQIGDVTLNDRLKATAARAAQLEESLGEREPGQFFLKVPADLKSEQLEDLLAQSGAQLKQELSIPDSMQQKFGGRLLLVESRHGLSEAQSLALIENDPRVLASGANNYYTNATPQASPHELEVSNDQQTPPEEPKEKLPNDLRPSQWNLRNRNVPGGTDGSDIQAGGAWKVTTGEGGPIVAVVDSGIDAFHEDLKDNMWVNPNETRNGEDDNWDGFTDDIHGIDAITGTGNIFDEVGHGTHVAGIIGAVGNNGKGVVGVNWDTQLMGLKITDGERVSLLGAVIGVLYAAENGARVVNHSWGGGINNPILSDVMASSPSLHVCAAGNAQQDSDVQPRFPAAYDFPNIISVGASTDDDTHLFFSNWGIKSVDVHAPGAIVPSTLPVHKYGDMSGTSMAAPHVSGVAALVLSRFPDLSNQQVKDRILYSADKVDGLREKSFSGGRVNAERALEVDNIAPAEVKEVKIQNLTSDGFELGWTGVGDDGLKGLVSQYDVWVNLGEEKHRVVPEFPGAAGTVEQVSFRTVPEAGERPFSVSLTPVDNVGNRSKTVNVSATLPTSSVPMEDNFDTDKGWQPTGTWGRVEEKGRGMVYTDSPDGNYRDLEDTGILSPKFDLSQMRSSTLRFDARMETEKWDFIWMDVTYKGAERFQHLDVIRGEEHKAGWNSFQFDLSKYDGKEDVQVRIRLRTSDKDNADGVYVDNLRIDAAQEK